MTVELSTLGTGGTQEPSDLGQEDSGEILNELQSLMDGRSDEGDPSDEDNGGKAGEADTEDPDGDEEDDSEDTDPDEEDQGKDKPKEDEPPAEAPVEKTEEEVEAFREEYRTEVANADKTAKQELSARADEIIRESARITSRISELGKIQQERELTAAEVAELGRLGAEDLKLAEKDEQLGKDLEARKNELTIDAHIRMNEKVHPELKPWHKEHLEAARQGITFKTTKQAIAYFRAMREDATGKPVGRQPTAAEIREKVERESLGKKRGAAITAGKGASGGQRDGDGARQSALHRAVAPSFAKYGLELPGGKKGGK